MAREAEIVLNSQVAFSRGESGFSFPTAGACGDGTGRFGPAGLCLTLISRRRTGPVSKAPAGGPCWKACLWSARKSEKQPPAPLITLLILGIVIHYVSFFSFRERKHRRARALSWAGRDLLPALFFGFPPCSSSSSLRGERGAAELPAPGLAGRRDRRTALALAQAQSVWPVWSSPRPLFTYPPSSAGLALRTGIVSLVTHSHQTLLEMLEKVGSRDIFGFIPVVKHLVFVSRFAQTLGPWWKLPPGGRGWVGRIPASPPWLP